MTSSSPGLADVVAATTVLSRVDGAAGHLVIAGLPLDQLVRAHGFAEVLFRLWSLGGRTDLPSDPSRALGEARVRAFASLQRPELNALLDQPDGMAALRQGLSLTCTEHAGPIELTAAAVVTAGAWVALRAGRLPIAPDPERAHAEDLLRMALGSAPPAASQALDTYLSTVVDHGLNASTFTARVVASTRADDLSAVLAAIGALKGPLHGGAPGPVLDMLDAIGRPEAAESWLRAELDQGRRIMGMGHRVYRVRDPRATVLEGAARRLRAHGIGGTRLALAQHVEATATRLLAERHPDRVLAANVEFATAVLLEAVGLPRAAFPVVFATGRIGGWLAHTEEQRRTGRLIRPRARYVGALPAAG